MIQTLNSSWTILPNERVEKYEKRQQQKKKNGINARKWKKKKIKKAPEGIEPSTSCLLDRRSNH